MLVWFMRLQELWKKNPKRFLYAFSALLPMTIMLVVWAFMGSYPFGTKETDVLLTKVNCHQTFGPKRI